MTEEPSGNTGNRFPKFEPLKYGDFLFPGRKTYSLKKQHVPTIEELGDVLDSEDHYIPLRELLSRLDTDDQTGLREEQVLAVRERYGENVVCVEDEGMTFAALKSKVRGTYYMLAFGLFLCIIAAVQPSFQTTEWDAQDNVCASVLMICMVVASACLSYSQEKRSDTVIASFRDLYPRYYVAIREGKRLLIHHRDLVVGDLVRFQAGDNIPADVRLTSSWNLEVEEAPLLRGGNSVLKTTECTSRNLVASRNVALAGTSCVRGIGQGIVIATGNRTVYGQLMKQIEIYQRTATATHTRMRRIWLLGWLALGWSLAMVVACTRPLDAWVELAVLVLCQIIASVPDVLYTVSTVCLCDAAGAMSTACRCLPKNYECVERMESVNVICCNKTGTMTQGRMTVVGLWIDGKMIDAEHTLERTAMQLQSVPHGATWRAFARSACLCSKTPVERRRERGIIKTYYPGDQLEIAVMEFLIETSGSSSSTELLDNTRRRYKKIFEIPFNPYRKYQVTVHELPGASFLVCVKGALDVILDFCSTVFIEGEDVPIAKLGNYRFQETFEDIMKDGEYVVGFCELELSGEAYPHDYVFLESNVPLFGLRFLGFISVLDPPRANTLEAVAKCKQAGIRVIMMTGDHRVTSKAVARQVGLISTETRNEAAQRFNISPEEVPLHGMKSAVITGSEVEAMDDRSLQELLCYCQEIVFARLNPCQKRKVVRCLQAEGSVVAITGDSPEDVPSMLQADIGIGLCKRGCDVSREAADIVLLGDTFASIVTAIGTGQQIFKNLYRAMVYVLSSNVPILSPLFAACLLRIPLTMRASSILLLILLSETIPVLLVLKENSVVSKIEKNRLGLSNFFDCSLVLRSYLEVGAVGFLSGMFAYLAIMAQNGFMPAQIIGIVRIWNSWAVNDLTDSYNQEWTYSSRKSLESTCQTAFFLAIIILQWFNIGLLGRWRSPRKCSYRFLITCISIPACQVFFLLFLIYTPGVSKMLHFYPIKLSEWILCLPVPIFYLIYEQLRRFIVQHSDVVGKGDVLAWVVGLRDA